MPALLCLVRNFAHQPWPCLLWDREEMHADMRRNLVQGSERLLIDLDCLPPLTVIADEWFPEYKPSPVVASLLPVDAPHNSPPVSERLPGESFEQVM